LNNPYEESHQHRGNHTDLGMHKNLLKHGIRQTVKEIKSKWKNMIMHGQYIYILDVKIINKMDKFPWFTQLQLNGKTENQVRSSKI
jgi:hypothetical protein